MTLVNPTQSTPPQQADLPQVQDAPTTPCPTLPFVDRQSMLALLDDLVNTNKYGTAEEQREALDLLKVAIDADRPGQRRIFGHGRNPA